MGLFTDGEDENGAPTLEPGPVLQTTGTANVSIPDPGPIVQASFPRLPMPAPVPPPPTQMQDPKQRLLTLMATLFAAGAGPHSGLGTGTLAGINQGAQQLHAENLQRWKYEAGQADQQRKIVEQEQAREDTQRAAEYQRKLSDFRAAAAAAPNKAAYDQLAESYGNAMRASGWRKLSPDWFRNNIPYVAKDKQALVQKAWKNWKSNPANLKVLNEHPELLMQPDATGALPHVRVDLNGDKTGEDIPIVTFAEMAGEGFAHTVNGIVAVPKTPTTGTSPFDVKYQALITRFNAENRRAPTPQENDKLVDQAIVASKEKPETEPRDHFTFVQGTDAAGKPVTLRGNTSTGELAPYAVPGATLGAPKEKKQLQGTQADQLSALNMAEVEGVKVLRALKSSGLTHSNNPADARWQKFVATTLKMESGDLNKADIQQRTAAVNAILTRGLMGGRPSQYVAEMIQQHMPQGEMTGAKLNQIMKDVLQQTGERRKEFENLTGRELGSLAPVSGETYDAYLKSEQQALSDAKDILNRRGR